MALADLAAPAHEHALDDRLLLVDDRLGHHRQADAARRLGDVRQDHDGGAGEVLADLLGGLDVVQLAQAPGRRGERDGALHVGADVAGVDGDGERLGGRQARLVVAVDEESPDLLERHATDEVVDVDAAVPQRGPFLVGLGDLALERDDSLEPVVHLYVISHVCILP